MIDMPKLKPVLIATKGLSFWSSLYAVLTSTRRWELTEDWHYVLPNSIQIVIPEGFIFDGASIPKPIYFMAGIVVLLIIVGVSIDPMLMLALAALFVLSGVVLSATGILLIAGLVHDFAYRYGYLWAYNPEGYYKYKYGKGGRLDWDELFFRVNVEVNGAVYIDYLAAGLLKMFGGIAWADNRNLHAEDIDPK